MDIGHRNANRVIPVPANSTTFGRDPADAMFQARCNRGNADFLITGDNDLLSLALSIKTRIIPVADFRDRTPALRANKLHYVFARCPDFFVEIVPRPMLGSFVHN